jgi:hypothetical protein
MFIVFNRQMLVASMICQFFFFFNQYDMQVLEVGTMSLLLKVLSVSSQPPDQYLGDNHRS